MTTKTLTHDQALKEAEEYVKLGKDKKAFQTLFDFINSKRKNQWTIVYEKIMTLFIDLTIRLQKFSSIKDAMNQYKYISQASNINSLEIVVLYYREKMENFFKEKINQIHLEKLEELEDIDSEESPENLFLLSVDMKSKSEREESRALMKNIWDCYKNIVEIVRTNNKLEDALSSTCEKIFKFCTDYKRKTEFKRFSESHRFYVSKLIKNLTLYPDYLKNSFAVDITENQTNEKYLNIFASQMQTALSLKLWQEAFKISDDMHNVMKVRKTILKPKFLSSYFENLGKVFWSSRYYLYHANAFYSHYVIYKKFSKASSDEITAKSNQLFLSILAIPPFAIENEQKDENRNKISNLLSSSGTLPQRQELITIIRNTNLLELVSPEISELFSLLEDEFNLLTFSKKVERLFAELEKNSSYEGYLPAIKNNLVYKILKSLREAYKVVTLEKLYRILHIIPSKTIENIILTAHVQKFIRVQIDHHKKIIIFENEDFSSKNEFLIRFAREVASLREGISEEVKSPNSVDETNIINEAKNYLENADKALNNRRAIITETKKPEIYQRMMKDKLKDEDEKRQQEEALKEEELKKKKIDDKKKLKEAELKENDLNRKYKFLQEIIKIKGNQVVKLSGKKLESFERDELADVELADLEELRSIVQTKEKENQENKYKRSFLKVDYLERARREEEKNAIMKQWEADQKDIDQIKKTAEEVYKRNFLQKQAMLETYKFKEKHIKTKLEKRKELYDKEIALFKQEITKEFKEAIIEKAKESLEKQKKRDEEERKLREKQDKERSDKELELKQDIEWRVGKSAKEIKETKPEPNLNFRSNAPVEKKKPVEQKPLDTDDWRKEKVKVPVQDEEVKKDFKKPMPAKEDDFGFRKGGAPSQNVSKPAPKDSPAQGGPPKRFENRNKDGDRFGNKDGGDRFGNKDNERFGKGPSNAPNIVKKEEKPKQDEDKDGWRNVKK